MNIEEVAAHVLSLQNENAELSKELELAEDEKENLRGQVERSTGILARRERDTNRLRGRLQRVESERDEMRDERNEARLQLCDSPGIQEFDARIQVKLMRETLEGLETQLEEEKHRVLILQSQLQSAQEFAIRKREET